MTTLIILAHPGSTSFNSQWAQATAAACDDEVLWSDLYKMDFNPVEKASHYDLCSDAFDPLKAQSEAANSNKLPNDVTIEIEKIRAANRLVFHFPLWWFSPPAILKGWADRCLTHGAMHRNDARFDTGLCKGKEALFCVTTGASEIESASNGKEGDTHMHLWHFAYSLRYCGFSVKRPLLFHGIHGYFEDDAQMNLEKRCKGTLSSQTKVIKHWNDRPDLSFNPDSDFDEQGRLKTSAPCYSEFIKN